MPGKHSRQGDRECPHSGRTRTERRDQAGQGHPFYCHGGQEQRDQHMHRAKRKSLRGSAGTRDPGRGRQDIGGTGQLSEGEPDGT